MSDKKLDTILKKLGDYDRQFKNIFSELSDVRGDLKSVHGGLDNIRGELDVVKQNIVTKDYLDQAVDALVSTVDDVHDKLQKSIDNLELNTVKRTEFEALKRKVERYHTN